MIWCTTNLHSLKLQRIFFFLFSIFLPILLIEAAAAHLSDPKKNHKRKTKHCVNIGLIYFYFLSFISILYLPGLNSKHSCYWSNFQSLFWKLCHINVAKESPQWKTGKTVYKTTQWKPKWKSGQQERQKSRIPAPLQRYLSFFTFFCEYMGSTWHQRMDYFRSVGFPSLSR